DGERLRRRHDAELLPVLVDHANLADPNPLVHTNTIVASRSSVESDNGLPCRAGRTGRSGPASGLFDLAVNLVQRLRDERLHAAGALVAAAPGPHGHRAGLGLAVPNDEHVVHLLELCLPDLISDFLLARVEPGAEPGGPEPVPH